MKYICGCFEDKALYYDTDLERAFFITKSQARKKQREIDGVSIVKHNVCYDLENKTSKAIYLKASLAGLIDKSFNYTVKVDNNKLHIKGFCYSWIKGCFISVGTTDFNSFRYPLALVDFIKFLDEAYFYSHLDYVYDLYISKFNRALDLGLKVKSEIFDNTFNSSSKWLSVGKSRPATFHLPVDTGKTYARLIDVFFDIQDKRIQVIDKFSDYLGERYLGETTITYNTFDEWFNALPPYTRGYDVASKVEFKLDTPQYELLYVQKFTKGYFELHGKL